MTFQIHNQTIKLFPNKTEITVKHDVQRLQHNYTFPFNLFELEKFANEIKAKNRAEYYWLANLFVQLKNIKPIQLSFQF